MNFVHLGRVPFAEAFALQELLAEDIRSGAAAETVLFLEHPSIYTIGRGGSPANVLDPEVTPVEVNRGGDITWHGPGQLVCYPLLDLSRRGRDLHRYLRFLEQVLIDSAARLGVSGYRVGGRTGVWTAAGKIASIGVGVRRWVSMHGFALNVDPELAPFSRIHPCGIVGCPVTSLAELLGRGVTVEEAAAAAEDCLRLLLPRLLPRTGRQDSFMDWAVPADHYDSEGSHVAGRRPKASRRETEMAVRSVGVRIPDHG